MPYTGVVEGSCRGGDGTGDQALVGEGGSGGSGRVRTGGLSDGERRAASTSRGRCHTVNSTQWKSVQNGNGNLPVIQTNRQQRGRINRKGDKRI